MGRYLIGLSLPLSPFTEQDIIPRYMGEVSVSSMFGYFTRIPTRFIISYLLR